jgi:hypothetical protein
MFHRFVEWRFCETPAADTAALQFLRNLFELITLDHIAYLVFAEVAQLDPAFQPGAHFFHVVLETPQRRNAAVVNRLALSQNTCPPSSGDATIGDQATGNNASA